MRNSRNKDQEEDADIRRKIIQNTMVYNEIYDDRRKKLAETSPVRLLNSYQKETPTQDLKIQSERNMKFKLDQL